MINEVYRCDLTIDLEEAISMTDQKKFDNIRAIATYKSGREERVTGQLKTDQTPYKKFTDKVDALKAFPTVEKVKLEKF